MLKSSRYRWLLSSVSTAAIACIMAQTADAQTRYVSGDFHNHTTCSDGTSSVQRMMTAGSVTFGLDWLVQTDHGGNSYRDCKFDDFPAGDSTGHLSPAATAPADAGDHLYHAYDAEGVTFKGDKTTATGRDGVKHNAMWRWQNIAEFEYAQIEALSRSTGKLMFEGVEQIVPGHEHSEVTVVNGQIPASLSRHGNANAVAQFEYLWDRADGDMTGGAAAPYNWAGKISNTGTNTVPGVPGTSVSVTGSYDTSKGIGAHQKSVVGAKWLQDNYPLSSYYIPAHVERAGPFNPAGNNGFNVESFRDYNNAAPTVAVGFESQPGHQADHGRGSYGTGAVGGGTYGGTGIYAAAVGGLWDAMLGEGRNWFFFASSDFHNRGIFAPTQKESTADFFPGEYQKQWVSVTGAVTPQAVVNAIRTGDVFSVQGDLITNDLSFTACEWVANACVGTPVGMGRTLAVNSGSDVKVTLTVTLPASGATNNSPYSFPNPVLKSAGLPDVPLNKPKLDHLDLITGQVTGVVDPSSPNYKGLIGSAAASNPTTAIAASFGSATWTQVGQKVTASYIIHNVTGPRYVRGRATNLPAGILNATDAAGNPLLDTLRNNIPCSDAACPSHIVIGGSKKVDADIRGWSELWAYMNPIFIRTHGNAPLLVETNTNKARTLAGLSPL